MPNTTIFCADNQINRTIEREVTSAVALVLAGQHLPSGSCIHLSVADGGLIAQTKGPTRPPESRPRRDAPLAAPIPMLQS